MTSEEFRVAIAKGQGRAVLAAQHDARPYADAIIEACLHDRRFEPLAYESQAPYLHFIVTQASLQAEVIEAILAALPACPIGLDRQGMIDLLGLFARTGSERAFEALVPLADAGDVRAQDGLATSGDPGLEWVVEHILPRIPPDEQGFVWIWLVNGGWDDRTPTRTRLRVIRQAAMARPRRPSSQPNPYFLKTFDAAFETESSKAADPPGRAIPFGHLGFTSEPLFGEADAERTRAIVAAHRERKMRVGVKNLIPMPGAEIWSEAACLVLGQIDSLEVRAFGLELLGRSPIVPRALQSLRSSARAEDIDAVLTFLERTMKADLRTRNFAAKDADEVARAQWKRPWQPLEDWAYENAPNAEARSSAFDWIVRVGKVPPPMLEEARYDISDYTRDQAAERSRKPRPNFLRFAARNA